ncbi:MAG: S8 family serine peptidase [Kiritimatiellia bacterium]|jgi:hypothetical protein|nr:S8 family serine peptidase [Kiritimatiellia bacterium]
MNKKVMMWMVGFCLVGLWISSAWGQGAPLLLDWGVVDTSSAEQQRKSQQVKRQPKAATVQRLSSRETAPWLVQFNDVIREEWKMALVAAGAEIRGYMPENGFVVLATRAQIAVIGGLPDVIYVGEFLPAYKRSKQVRQLITKAGEEVREYNVWTYRPEDAEAIALEVAGLTGAQVTHVEALPDRGLVRAILPVAAVETATSWGEVEWVDPYLKRQLWNDVATRTSLMNVSNVWSVLGLTGAGQTIAVCDTGLDTGNTGTLHPDFTGRVTGFGWTNGSYNASYSWADYDAHGTHVAGSVLGNGTMSTGKYRGVAYEADLIFQGANASLNGIPYNLNTLFQQAFDNGARIHSDSWGYDDDGYYNSDSRYLDMFTWSNKTMLVLIAAGNQGTDANSDGVVDLDSIGSPGTAKNCLTVGAAETDRPEYSAYTWGSSWPSDFPANPIKDDEISGPDDGVNQGIAGFSSRGPCDDGRIKPDLMAPGTDIISTRSTRTTDTGWGVAPNTNYLLMGGTSMATPLTAGAAGLAREWTVTTGGVTNPSGALIKGLLINGARNMSPGQYGTGSYREISAVRPDNRQGWGHVDLFTTLKPTTNQFLDLIDTNSLSTGQSNTFTYTVTTTTTNKFILTLAYADYWGTVGSGKQLVNDLDLTVQKPSGTTLYANGRTSKDATNNVEMIEFAADEYGIYTVRVSARTVPSGGSQPYALVIRGPKADETPTAPSFGANPGPVSATSSVATVFTVATTNGYPTPVLALLSQTASSGYSFVPATGVLTYTPPAVDVGTNTFTFTATNTEGAATQVVTVVVSEGPPTAPASLWASATNSTDFTAAWSSVSGATSYRLDVATNATFSGGGGGGGTLIDEDFTSFSDWTDVGTANDTTHAGDSSPCRALGPGDSLTSPSVNYPTQLVFFVDSSSGGNGKTTTNYYSLDGGLTWLPIGTFTVGTAGATETQALTSSPDLSGETNVLFRFVSAFYTWYLDDVLVTGGSPALPSYVPGYSNRTVAGTSQSVTGLTAASTYYFRARTVAAGGTSLNSSTSSVVTLGAGTPPVMVAIPDQVTGVGADFEYTVTAMEGDGDSYTFACTSTVDEATWAVDTNGYFLFIPTVTEVGTNVFTFRATDKDGTSAPANMSIRVNTQAATNAFEEWVEDLGQDPGSTNFTEDADYDGDGATTEDEYLADTDPTSSNSVLKLDGDYFIASEVGEDSGQIEFSFPASPARYYQLVYSTNLASPTLTNNLGLGVPPIMTITSAAPAAWYGTIRVLLDEPVD